MPKDFTCDTCFKNFKTTQHLKQHQNKKNKCKPPIFPYAQTNNINSPLSFQVAEYNGSGLSENLSADSDMTVTDITELTKMTSNLLGSNINSTTTISIKTLIDLIIKNKTLLEQLRQFEIENISLKKRMEKLRMENILHKKHTSVIEKFVEDLNTNIKKHNEYLYLSSLNENEQTPDSLSSNTNYLINAV
jgi:hypothetical protein